MADRYFEVTNSNVRYGDIQVLWDIESLRRIKGKS